MNDSRVAHRNNLEGARLVLAGDKTLASSPTAPSSMRLSLRENGLSERRLLRFE